MTHTRWMRRPRELALQDQMLVYVTLREHPGRRDHELAHETGLSRRRVIDALRPLEADGAVERNGRNWYPKGT